MKKQARGHDGRAAVVDSDSTDGHAERPRELANAEAWTVQSHFVHAVLVNVAAR